MQFDRGREIFTTEYLQHLHPVSAAHGPGQLSQAGKREDFAIKSGVYKLNDEKKNFGGFFILPAFALSLSLSLCRLIAHGVPKVSHTDLLAQIT